MLSLVTSALALTVGMKAGRTPTRAPPATMAASFESKFTAHLGQGHGGEHQHGGDTR